MTNNQEQVYSDQQLLHMAKNFKLVHINLIDVFNKIGESEEGIAMNMITEYTKVSPKLSPFVRDKCISALELPGLITRDVVGTQKICKLTQDGKKLKELLNLNRG